MCAVVLHLFLLGFIIIHFNFFEKVKPASAFVSNARIINAVMVNQNKVDNELKKIKQAEQQKRLADQEKLRKLQEEKQKLAQQKLEELKQIEQLKKQKQEEEKRVQALKEEAKKVAELKAKQLQEKKKLQEVQAKKKKEEERLAKIEKEKVAKKKLLELAEKEKSLEDELAAEDAQITSANNRRMMSEIERYTDLIRHEVGRHWIVPDNAKENTRCVLLIRVGPGGLVKEVKLLTSSGEPALDRSAQNAVFRASPLPVPEDPELFEKFREIKLVVRPEGYLS